jgi:pyruvate kinase
VTRAGQDLLWGVENDVDFVAASFIRKASDVRTVIAYLERCMQRYANFREGP